MGNKMALTPVRNMNTYIVTVTVNFTKDLEHNIALLVNIT